MQAQAVPRIERPRSIRCARGPRVGTGGVLEGVGDDIPREMTARPAFSPEEPADGTRLTARLSPLTPRLPKGGRGGLFGGLRSLFWVNLAESAIRSGCSFVSIRCGSVQATLHGAGMDPTYQI